MISYLHNGTRARQVDVLTYASKEHSDGDSDPARDHEQARGGEIVKIFPGQTIYTPPGEEHWHGATPDHFMSHLAMWEGVPEANGPETIWREHLTEKEYPSA